MIYSQSHKSNWENLFLGGFIGELSSMFEARKSFCEKKTEVVSRMNEIEPNQVFAELCSFKGYSWQP